MYPNTWTKLEIPTSLTAQHWPNDMDPLVSIWCIAYNHVDFIEEAIKSFLMQETTFAVEIIIHDDSSTDGTADIIRRYKKDYPNLIQPIFQRVNQWSQGINPFLFFCASTRAKYIALCEGDDYWTDSQKLERQIDVFRKYPDVSICFHPALEKNMVTGEECIICNHFSEDQFVDFHSVILGRGGYMPTASLVFRNDETKLMIQSFQNAPIGDFFIQAFQASRGRCYYLNEPFCVYRRSASGSWTASQHADTEKLRYAKAMLEALDHFHPNIKHKPGSDALYDVYYFYLKSASHFESSFLRKAVLYLNSLLHLSNLSSWRLFKMLFARIIRVLIPKDSI